MDETIRRVGAPRAIFESVRSNRGAQYAILASVALIGAIVILRLWTTDLSIPLYYLNRRDTLNADAFIKGMLETGWFYENPSLGRPLGSIAYDYPTFSLVHEVTIRLLLYVVPNPGFVLNLFFVLGFPLTAISAYFALGRLGIAKIPAATVALLYAFLPYRIWRNETHLFYASFYFVPLVVLVVLWVARGERLVEIQFERGRRPRLTIARNGWLALAFCTIVGSDNQYHAFFTGALVICAMGIAYARERLISSILTGFALLGVIFVGLVVNIVPTFIYHIAHASEFTSPFVRFPKEAELYSLSFAQLVLPIENHRLEWLAEIRAFYNRQFTTSINENSSVSLGLIASIGFVALVWNRIRRTEREGRYARLRSDLGGLVLFSFLLGTFGGIGALFSYYVNDNIRAYNRIAPFIGFMAFANVAIFLEALWLRVLRDRPRRAAYGALASAGIVVLGILDQTADASIPDPVRTSAVYAQDGQFVARIEAAVPARSSIYELPFVHFPEAGQGVILPDFTEIIPYLHSKSLRWSYGAFATTEAGLWQAHVDQFSTKRMVESLAIAGFAGIFVFRDGYADAGVSVERALQNVLHDQPIVGGDGHYSFFNLAHLAKTTADRLGPERFAADRESILHPVTADIAAGCSYLERSGQLRFHWCGHDATIVMRNPTPTTRRLHLNFTLATGFPKPSHLTMTTARGTSTINVDSSGATYDGDVDVPSGSSKLRIHSDAEPIVAPDDPRELVFQLRYFKAKDPKSPYPW